MQVEHLLILTTCPNLTTAKQIAQVLVIDNMAACVNIVPGLTSYFKWDGKIESDDELLLLIKTTAKHLTLIEKKIKSLHPHELPEIIVVSIKDGLREYLRWIEDSTK